MRSSRVSLALAVLLSAACNSSHADPEIGKAAPDFALPASDGKTYALSALKGKTVVLEWWNHQCPFVRKHYGAGNMQRLQKDYTAKGVVWLAVQSSALGKEGNVDGDRAAELMKESGASPTAVLLDPLGTAGRSYAAKTTPHMFVIDPSGTLVYKGAIDDRPSTDPADTFAAKNYVAAALDETLAGKPVSIASTKPYGCGVKY